MKTFNSVVSILLILSVSFLAGCVKGTPNNPHPSIDYKLLSSGSIISITSLRDSFQVLALKDSKYQKEVDALNKILVIASPINDTIQNTTFPAPDNKALIDQIETFARLGAIIAATSGLSPDIVIAINLGIGVFKSIEPFILGSGSTSPTNGVTAARDAQADPRVKLGQLQALESKYKRTAGR